MPNPYIMTEEFWANSLLSFVRHFGKINFNGADYVIVDRLGRDIFECSRIAEKEGRTKAIEPGEPCDLCRVDLVPAYRALRRDRIIQLIDEGKTADEIKEIAGFPTPKRKTNKK